VCVYQKQNVRSTEERASERNPHAPASRELLGGLVLHLLRERETAQDRARARLGTVRIDGLHAVVQRLQAVGRSLNRVEMLLLATQLHQLAVGRQHGLDGRRVVAHHLLLDVEQREVRRDRDLARRDVAHQRTLTASVATHETVAMSIRELKRWRYRSAE